MNFKIFFIFERDLVTILTRQLKNHTKTNETSVFMWLGKMGPVSQDKKALGDVSIEEHRHKKANQETGNCSCSILFHSR